MRGTGLAEGEAPGLSMPHPMREYTVFNVDQCDGLPETAKTGKPTRVRNPDTRDALADEFLRSTGADIITSSAIEDRNELCTDWLIRNGQ